MANDDYEERDAARVERDALHERIGVLEAEVAALAKFRPARDPWQDRVTLLLDGVDRNITSQELLRRLGVPVDKQTVDHGRRLARVMREIGGQWQASTNIPVSNGMRVRGWLKKAEY